MSNPSTAVVNHWFDRRCARAFWSQQELPSYKELLQDTVSWLDPSSGETWLDLGCGSGQLSRALWQKSGGQLAGILALDCAATNEKALTAIRQSFDPVVPAERMKFRQADFSRGLPGQPDASFDGVVSGLAIQYAEFFSVQQNRWTDEAYDHLLGEIARVLRPGGRFIFSVNIPDPAWSRVALHGIPSVFTARRPLRFLRDCLRMWRYGYWLTREANRGRFHYLPANRIIDKLQAAGFAHIEYRRSYSRQAYLFRAYRSAE